MATPLNMSLNTNPFVDETFGIDPKVFAPLLKEDLTQSTPPFTIDNLLKDNNFIDLDSDGKNPYLITLNEILCNLQAGFLNSSRTLSHQQWLRSFSQVL
jgi:hypothetical protein